MQIKFLFSSLLLMLISSFCYGQNDPLEVDFNDPKNIAQNYLNACIKGERLMAGKEYCTPESMDQLEILVKQMVVKDIPFEEANCNYEVESCSLNENKNEASCKFYKNCNGKKGKEIKSLVLKLIDEKWLVDYNYKRDKFI